VAGERPIILTAAAGGATTALGFPPFDLPWLAPVGLAMLVLALREASAARAALLGAAHAAVFLGMTLWWLAEAISPFAWAAMVAAQSVWGALAGVAMVRVRRLHGWQLWAAGVFTAAESARAAVPWGGVPWGRLGYSAVDAPWSAWVAVIGVAATGTVVALLGCLIASVVEHATRRSLRGLVPAAAVVALVAVPAMAGGVLVTPNQATGPVARIAIVQGELPGSGREVVANHRALTEVLVGQTRQLAASDTGRPAPDLVVWPENAMAVDPTTDVVAGQAARAAVEAAGVPLLLGAVVDAPDARYALNQSLLWDDGGVRARYTKQRLVPFGEYVPLRPLAERLSSRVAAIPRDMLPGGDPEQIGVGSFSVATALCFDVAYDDVLRRQVARGGDLVSVQTSNAMFLGTAQLEQQWQVSRARALELGRSVVVSSVNGISGAIAPDGSVLERLPVRVAGSVVLDVPLNTSQTWAVRLGAAPLRLTWIIISMALLVTFAQDRRACRRRRRRRRLPPTHAGSPPAMPLDRSDAT
jgi:apolipoprotein N-acyltransferase